VVAPVVPMVMGPGGSMAFGAGGCGLRGCGLRRGSLRRLRRGGVCSGSAPVMGARRIVRCRRDRRQEHHLHPRQQGEEATVEGDSASPDPGQESGGHDRI
jgi:hypothetical protein